MEAPLYFRFKGNRSYIQGGDIFDALEASFAPQGRHVLTLTFRHFSSHQLVSVLQDPGDKAVAEGQLQDAAGQRAPFWLVETDAPVTERYEFDEPAITGHAQIDGDSIVADATPGYSVIEQVIALTKALNYARAPDVDGKWVFGQLRLRAPLPASALRYRIHQKALLAGRFSTQKIVLDDQDAGEIRFITGKP